MATTTRTVRIDDAVHQLAHRLAEREERTVKAIVQRALILYAKDAQDADRFSESQTGRRSRISKD